MAMLPGSQGRQLDSPGKFLEKSSRTRGANALAVVLQGRVARRACCAFQSLRHVGHKCTQGIHKSLPAGAICFTRDPLMPKISIRL